MPAFFSIARYRGFLSLVVLPLVSGAVAFAATAPAATIRDLTLLPGHANNVEIEIAASQPVATQTQVITGPDRLVIDIPNAVPATGLRDLLGVNRGNVKGVRVSLYSENPPTTRVVLDLAGPQRFQLFPTGNSVIVRMFSPAGSLMNASNVAGMSPAGAMPAQVRPVSASANGSANLTQFARTVGSPGSASPVAGNPGVASLPASVPLAASRTASAPAASSQTIMAANTPPPVVQAKPLPKLQVQFHNGQLSIWADKVSLTEVMNEVRRRTGAEVVVPPAASQEQIVANLGPASARDVLTALLNGSRFNFVMIGSDNNPSQLRGVYLTAKNGGGGEIQYPAIQATPEPQPDESSADSAADADASAPANETAPPENSGPPPPPPDETGPPDQQAQPEAGPAQPDIGVPQAQPDPEQETPPQE